MPHQMERLVPLKSLVRKPREAKSHTVHMSLVVHIVETRDHEVIPGQGHTQDHLDQDLVLTALIQTIAHAHALIPVLIVDLHVVIQEAVQGAVLGTIDTVDLTPVIVDPVIHVHVVIHVRVAILAHAQGPCTVHVLQGVNLVPIAKPEIIGIAIQSQYQNQSLSKKK